MKYKEYKGINYAEMATQVLKTWKKNKVFEKSVESRDGHPVFTFTKGLLQPMAHRVYTM